MSDIFDNIPAFEDIKREGLRSLPEYKKAYEEAYKEGKLLALRQALIHVVEARFPKLVRLARGEAAITDDPDELDCLVVKICIAKNVKEARAYLLHEDEDDDIN